MRKDGTLFMAELTVTRIACDGQSMFTAHIRDITGRKQAEQERLHLEQQLRQAQKMEAVGQLTGGIAHDFNNLLGVVLGNLELLGGRLGGDVRAAQYLEKAMANVQRGAQLTQRLHALSRQ